MRDDINRLVKPAQAEKRLPAAKNPPAIRAQTGLERSGQGGDVSSHEITVQSTDGVFTFTVKVADS